MKFSNTHNETFFLNLIKHDLNLYEWKVILAFIVDHPTEFNISLKTLEDRTNIAQPNISRALKGLVYQDILGKQNKKYELNQALLSKEYTPEITSSTEMRKESESTNIEGHGDFAQQSEIKKQKHEANIEGIRKMQKETVAKKKQFDGWQSYYSDIRQHNIFGKVETQESGQIIRFCSGNPKTDRTSIAPMDIAEEFCREVLKIENPNEMINYMYSAYVVDFAIKHNLKRPS
jgi:hypothetical protein